MSPGLWHEVILKKYLKKKSIVDWFREGRKSLKGMSNCWNALTSSMHLITDWLVWKPWKWVGYSNWIGSFDRVSILL
jgi:hypothetical protein